MSLQIYNSQSQKKELFEPLEPGRVKMYVCGPTVYDFLHVGNFRGAIFFNLVRNWLEQLGYEVTYVYNYTDVDDKIIKRAQDEGLSSTDVSERFIAEFERDYASLNLRPQSANPRVSEHIDTIKDFIRDLIDRKMAYVSGGDVYYDVHAFKNYGALSKKKLDDLEAGYRIEVSEQKKHSADFALWKASKPGEPAWDSPWGLGRPGWHIECSAMIRALLGDQIDIHGGGMDLLFPHHENEVAQSEGCTGKQFVRYWMHNNMVQFGQAKMSKSVGNVVKARDFIEANSAEILKFMVLSSHYRSLVDLSPEQIGVSTRGLARIYSAMAFAKTHADGAPLAPHADQFQKLLEETDQKIIENLNDDFNTPEVMARLFEVTRVFNQLARKPGPIKEESKALCEIYYHWMRAKGQPMALFQEDPVNYLRSIDDLLLKEKGLDRDQIDALVKERHQARLAKDYAKSDQLRDQINGLGIQLRDSVDGTEWEVDK